MLKYKIQKKAFQKGGFYLIGLTLALFMFISIVPNAAAPAPINTGKIDPGLLDMMDSTLYNDSEIRVIVIMKDQYKSQGIHAAEKKSDKKERINEIKQMSYGSQKDISDHLNKKGTGRVRKIRQLWIVNAISLQATPDMIQEISRRDDVDTIIPDHKVNLLYAPGGGGTAWGVSRINATDIWNIGYNGSGINVSVIDTGIHVIHHDLDDLDDNSSTTDPKVIKWMDYVNGTPAPYDDNGHGTHVAGIISGTGADGMITGVAPGTRLLAAKVLDSTGNGSLSDVFDASQWSVDNGADIISISAGSGIHDPLMTTMVDNAISAGVLVVVAAGNGGPGASTVLCPGDELNAITVGAVDGSDNAGSFSSRGPVTWVSGIYIKPDLAAPGVNIISTYNDGGYIVLSGTSMAAPHVSGAAALILQANLDMAPLDIKKLLESTAIDLGSASKDNTFGSGRIDVLAAFKVPAISDISINPAVTETVNITLNASIKDPFSIISYAGFFIDSDQNNISVLSAVDGSFDSTSENVTGMIDVAGMADGNHTVTFSARDASNKWNNYTSSSFSVDRTPPLIQLNFPVNGTSIKAGAVVNISIYDLSLASATYSLNSTQPGFSNITDASFYVPFEIDTGGFNESTYDLMVRAKDQLNQTGSSDFIFLIDNTPPNITSVSHNGTGILVEGDVLWVNITGDPGNNSTFNITGTDIEKVLSEPSSGYYSINHTIGHGADVNNATLWGCLTDAANNTFCWNASDTVSIDTLAPRIELISPENNSYIRSGTLINFSVQDAFLANVTITVDSDTTTFDDPYLVNTTGWNENQHDLTIWANDSFDRDTTRYYNFTIDDTRPDLVVESPSSDYATTLTSATISGTADPDASISINEEMLFNDNGSFSVTKGLALGHNIFTINASDLAGNVNSTVRTITRHVKVSSSASSGGGGATGTGEDFNNIGTSFTRRTTVIKEDHVNYSFNDQGSPVVSINFDAKVSAGWITSKIEVLRNTSSLVEGPAPGLVYKNINIWVGNYGWANEMSIANATISFRVSTDWIESNDIEPASITLHRYYGGTWTPLPTSMINRNDSIISYLSYTPGFSPFAISATPVLPDDPEPALDETLSSDPIPPAEDGVTTADMAEDGPEPGRILFSLLSIIMGLSIVSIVYGRKDELQELLQDIRSRYRR